MDIFIGTKLVQAEQAERDGKPGYRVIYTDGYESWSPPAEFEKAYQSVTLGMSFGAALFALKRGDRVARQGWNGKGMWLALIDPGNAMFTKFGSALPMLPCIGMKTATSEMCPGWLPSQTDMLAEDWVILHPISA